MNLLLWGVKGYDGVEITSKILDNSKWSFDEVLEKDSEIVNDIKKALDNGGEVFGLSKKKILKSIYIFKVIKIENERVLVFDKKLILDEVSKCTQEFENDLETILGSTIVERDDVDKAIWNDKEIEPVAVNVGKYEWPVALSFIFLGIFMWIVFDNFMWFWIYLPLAFSSGYTIKATEKKRKISKAKKSKNNKKVSK